MFIFFLHCTHLWALPADSSWSLTLACHSSEGWHCCSSLHIRNRSAVTDWGRSAARSDHSPLGRKDGHTASGLIHFKLLSLRAVPTRLDPSSAVTLRTVTAHQVLRCHQASRACTEAPVTRDRDISPTLKEHPSGVHARDKEPSPQGIPARRRRVYLRVSRRGAHLLTECGNRCDQGQAT